MLWQRVLTAILGIPLAILLVYFGEWPFFLCVTTIGLLGLKEYFFIFNRMGFKSYSFLGYISGILLLTFTFIGIENYLSKILLLLFLFITLLYIIQFNQKALGDLAGTFLGVFYVCGLLSFALVLRNQLSQGFWWIMLILVLVWVNDSGAYFTGRIFGRHKLHQAVSPKKTVEGALGGILASIVIAAIVSHLVPLFSLLQGMFLALIIALVGIVGDLFESALKREAGLKDSGNLLPGHGGILDRFDSLLFALPAAYYFIQGFIIG